jgi:hypothetical protein
MLLTILCSLPDFLEVDRSQFQLRGAETGVTALVSVESHSTVWVMISVIVVTAAL